MGDSAQIKSKKALVEVDIGKLESYLVSIKDQLSRHEEELHNPVWWPAFKAEVDQVAVLGRKVEHQGLDINILRDMLANSEDGKDKGKGELNKTKSYSPYGGGSSHQTHGKEKNDGRVDLLAADVEAVKLLVRRIEAQRAVEHTVFSQIRDLQRSTRSIQQLVDERAPSEALQTLMGLVVSMQKIKPLFDSRLSAQEEAVKADIMKKVPGMAERISNEIYQQNRAKETECVPLMEFNLKTRKMEKFIREVKEELQAFTDQAGLKSMVAGKRTLNDIVKKRLTVKQRDLLTRWKVYTIEERRIDNVKKIAVMGTALRVIKASMDKMGMHTFLQFWKYRVHMLKTWDLYRIRVTKMIMYWISRVEPDMKVFLLRWKSHTILRRSHVMQATADLRILMPAAQEQLKDLPDADLSSKIVVLGESILKVATAHNVQDDFLMEHKKAFLQTNLTVETNQVELNAKIDTQCQAIMSNLSRHQNSSIKSFSSLGLAQEKHENFVTQEFTRVDENADHASKKIKVIQDRLDIHDHKFERILLLQGDILGRLEKLEASWNQIFVQMTACEVTSTEANDTAQEATKITRKLNTKVEESLFFYDEEFKGIRNGTKIAHRLIEETAYKHRDILVKVMDMERGMQTRLDDADSAIHAVQPVRATVEELAEMCAEFEMVAIMGLGHGREATDIIHEEHVCVPLSKYVLRLARQMSEELRQQFIEQAISGPHAAPPMASAISTSAIFNENDLREQMLNEFNDQFVSIIRSRDDEPGFARAQARVVFHRRFMAAMRTALNTFLGNGKASGGGGGGSPQRSPHRSPGKMTPSQQQQQQHTMIGERIARDISALSRSAGLIMENRPLTSPNAPPVKWQPKVNTDIIIKKDDNRSKADYDFYTMGPPTDPTMRLQESMAASFPASVERAPDGNEYEEKSNGATVATGAGDSSHPYALKAFPSTLRATGTGVLRQNVSYNSTTGVSMLDRQNAERSLSAGAVRHRSAVNDANSMSTLAAKAGSGVKNTEINTTTQNMRKLANALAATFDPPKSVPYERSQQVEMEGGRSPNPLQSRKLYTSTS